MTQSDPSIINPPSENVVNRIVEIFDVENFNGFLELARQVEAPGQLLQFIDEQEDIDLFSDSFDDLEFSSFVLDLVEIDGKDVSAAETGSIVNDQGAIAGTKWDDRNGDGVRNENELGLAGWTIYLDDNQNGQLDESETFVITDSKGNYLFEGLEATQTYVVAEVPKSSDVLTFPNEDISLVSDDNPNSEGSAYTGTPNDPLFANQWHLQNTGLQLNLKLLLLATR